MSLRKTKKNIGIDAENRLPNTSTKTLHDMPYAEYSDGVDDTCSTVIGGDSSREEKIVKTSEDIGHPHQQISQTNRRESRDIHGFSRAAASVFDDDPFFNDEKEQSGAKMSDFTSKSRSWGRFD